MNEPETLPAHLPTYAFSANLIRWHDEHRTKGERSSETITARTMKEALAYWAIEFQDESVEVEAIFRGEPILADAAKSNRSLDALIKPHVPFTFDDQLCGMVFASKVGHVRKIAVWQDERGVFFHASETPTYAVLLRDWVQLSGEPAGKLKG